ncbi:ASCH domain-containing protein [Kribbella jiaozuonensis]|uniref:ASCH domain-containing protein n=1 Tax=Kribbella jiaozuonensis TaxID=2575441 RepID=A0A4V5UYA0_9ACTN|nr:ASCH domain-containing protein [Kribbella jiaozuonensis]TKK82583.1 ASCH domain-containing protein [Kribbella jiaozuonensis]
MLFAGSDRDGVADGKITVAYRRWAEPRVVEGRIYRTNAGRIEIDSIRTVNPELIADTDAEVALADRRNAKDVRRRLRGDESMPTFLIRFHLVEGPDPREELAAQTSLSADDLADLRARLAQFDQLSHHGAWTVDTLRLIQSRPATRAADLAASVGRETAPFKLDVRKLKNLGLTHSLEVGYELSPRGAAYLDALGN